VWKDVDGMLHFTPWDFDLAWGGYPYNDCDPHDWISYRTGLIDAMASVPVFREALATRWAELRADTFSDDAILGRLAVYRDVMGEVAYDSFDVWEMSEIAFMIGWSDWLCPVDSYDEEVARLDTWVLARLAWMDDNIEQF